MTFVLLVGYAICIMNIVFLAQSKCKNTGYYNMGTTNTVIFLVLGSFAIGISHVLILFN